MVKTRSLVLTVILGATLLTVAAPALAGTAGPTVDLGAAKGLRYVKVTMQDVATQAGPPALCAAGREVTGGGGTIGGAGGRSHLNATYPLDVAGTGWMAEGRVESGPPAAVTTFGVCGRGDVTWSTTSDPIAQGASQGIGQQCGPGTRQTAAGPRGSGGDVHLLAINPLPDIFDGQSMFHNEGPGAATISQALGCTADYRIRFQTRQVALGRNKTATLKAACGKRQAVLGGGFGLGAPGFEPPGTFLKRSRPVDLRTDRNEVPDDAWMAHAYNGSGERLQFSVHAVCLKAHV